MVELSNPLTEINFVYENKEEKTKVKNHQKYLLF